MKYIIKRETQIPWDNTIKTFKLNGEIYDLVESSRNTGLDSVAEIVLDENNVIVKSPMNEVDYKTELKKVGIEVYDLILG